MLATAKKFNIYIYMYVYVKTQKKLQLCETEDGLCGNAFNKLTIFLSSNKYLKKFLDVNGANDDINI